MTTEPARTGASSTRHRWAHRIAGLPSGRRTKWAVLVFWVIVIALTGSLAGKLMGAEKNDASAYLPASAESTQALKLQDHFTSKNLNPAVVVYVRPSGLTPADLAKITADAKKFANAVSTSCSFFRCVMKRLPLTAKTKSSGVSRAQRQYVSGRCRP